MIESPDPKKCRSKRSRLFRCRSKVVWAKAQEFKGEGGGTKSISFVGTPLVLKTIHIFLPFNGDKVKLSLKVNIQIPDTQKSVLFGGQYKNAWVIHKLAQLMATCAITVLFSSNAWGTMSFVRSSFVRTSVPLPAFSQPVHREISFPDQLIEIDVSLICS